MKNKIGPKRVRRESPGAETLCAKSYTPGQRFHQNFGFRGVEKRVKTVILNFFPKILWGGFFHIILRLRGSLDKIGHETINIWSKWNMNPANMMFKHRLSHF